VAQLSELVVESLEEFVSGLVGANRDVVSKWTEIE
jgi:hypothetical protein